jgi:hypothetical protein
VDPTVLHGWAEAPGSVVSVELFDGFVAASEFRTHPGFDARAYSGNIQGDPLGGIFIYQAEATDEKVEGSIVIVSLRAPGYYRLLPNIRGSTTLCDLDSSGLPGAD